MIIKSLHLNNYRCFKDFRIGFDERLTVLVGKNGVGKTAVLDALSFFLKNITNHISKNYQIYELPIDDVSVGCRPEDFSYCIDVQSRVKNYSNLLPINHSNLGLEYVSENMGVPLYGDITQLLDNEKVLCSTYMSGRFIQDKDASISERVYNPSSFAAFESNFERTIDYASTLLWFNNMDADEARAMREKKLKVNFQN